MEKNKKKISLWFLGVLLLAVFYYANQNLLVQERYEVYVSELPDSFDGFRIALLSDLHGKEFGKDNHILVNKLASEAPDCIALTGDFISEDGDTAVFATLLSQLQPLAPCYFVSGNHEWAYRKMHEMADILKACDAQYLNNRYTFIQRGEDKLCICGVDDPNSYADMITPPQLVDKLHQREGDIPVLYLCHRNDTMEKMPLLDVDVVLCGHGHGGILRLPFVGGLLGVDRKLFPRYCAGLYENSAYSMVVSRGMGNIHRIPRLFNFPEIVIVTLKKAV